MESGRKRKLDFTACSRKQDGALDLEDDDILGKLFFFVFADRRLCNIRVSSIFIRNVTVLLFVNCDFLSE